MLRRTFKKRPSNTLVVVIAAAFLVGLANDVYAQATRAEHLVWSDEFNGKSSVPDPANWKFETGGDGWGNHELETHCAPGSGVAPCVAAKPNVVVTDGYLHVVARRDAAGKWTSARMTTKGLQSFQYGRIEARIQIPAGPGVWPAFWMLGDNVDERHWPACGELDIMENVGKEPGKIHGSVHGTGFTGTPLTTVATLPGDAEFAAGFHTYGTIWSPGKVQYYVDDPAHPYATYTRADLPQGAVWPFDDGRYFFILNLAMGGDWPGPPAATTPATVEMLVDYVRVYQDEQVGSVSAGPGKR
jgi:beta-glucanase (GH16 family)